MGAWQKHMLSFRAAEPLAKRMASERFHTDFMEQENDFIFSLLTKSANFLTKTPFQLGCMLHDILMPLCTMYMYTESDSCDYSVVGIFPRKEIFWKTLHFCVSL